MYNVSTIDIINPKQITDPSGPHSGDRLIIIGITPTEAAAEVKKIGRIRRFPAARAASRIGILFLPLNTLGIVDKDNTVTNH